MKLPVNINKTLSQNDYGLFPPPGFLTMEETGDGAGDYYGLYWQIGREAEYPIVCMSGHEDLSLIPEFKDYESFAEWFEETEGQQGPTMALDDTDFFLSLMIKGKLLTKKGNNADAIEKLERSLSLFDEYCESWYWLSENYFATGQKEKGDRAIVNCISSNFLFGFPLKKIVDRFNEMQPSQALEKHPIVKRRAGLINGGDFLTPLSMNYDLMLEIVHEFQEEGDFRMAMLMKQNFGLMMSCEPIEIRSKYKFELVTWSEQFRAEMLSIYPDRKFK
jgi:tetratricopeptide (TPR) repeat protein